MLVVASALPGTTSAVPGQMEAAAQPVPGRKAVLASHPLQLLKVSEQLLIVPGAANEIIAVWRWEPLPDPVACRPPPWAQLAHALDPIGFGKPLGNPSTAPAPFAPRPLPTWQSARGLWHRGWVQGQHREGRAHVLHPGQSLAGCGVQQ